MSDNDTIGALRDENRILRGLVQTNPGWRCPHGMAVTTIAECPSGFPGCDCADDRISVLCEDGSRLIIRLRKQLAEARADSELLDEVERFLKECGDLAVFEVSGDYFIDDPPDRIVAPTLREALRKLVGEES